MATSEKTDTHGLVGTELAGRYRIDAVVEEGGFGVIYKGEHTALKKPVAIKVLKLPADHEGAVPARFVQSFTHEAQVIARMAHPHIVQVVDFGVADMPDGVRAPWMAMEWLDGKPLSKVLKDRAGQPFSPREALELMRPVFDALAYAHDQGIAHRDLKPANIMMLELRRAMVPKLLDFGIAKVMDENEQAGSGHTLTRSANLAFSPRYAAPEQISQARTGPWTDVHALGLIMTELITGRPAITASGKDTTQIFSQILRPERPTPRSKGADAGPWEPVLAKAMALSPQDRYTHAAELLAALSAEVPASVGSTFQIGPPVGPGGNMSVSIELGAAVSQVAGNIGQTTMAPSVRAVSERAQGGSGRKVAFAVVGAALLLGGVSAFVLTRHSGTAAASAAASGQGAAPLTQAAAVPPGATPQVAAPGAPAQVAAPQPAAPAPVAPSAPPVAPAPTTAPEVAPAGAQPALAAVPAVAPATQGATPGAAQPAGTTPAAGNPAHRTNTPHRGHGLGFDIE